MTCAIPLAMIAVTGGQVIQANQAPPAPEPVTDATCAICGRTATPDMISCCGAPLVRDASAAPRLTQDGGGSSGSW